FVSEAPADRFAEARAAPGHERDPPGQRVAAHRNTASPPSAGTTAPDVYADRSLARNSAIVETSSAVPSRFNGIVDCKPATHVPSSPMSRSTFRKCGVSIDPGAITLARTSGPYSDAI